MNAMRYLPHANRIVLGLIFFVFGLNGFLNFFPPPADLPADVQSYMGALTEAKIFVVVKLVEVVVGALLLLNRYVSLALVLLAPVVVGIVLFHTVMAPPNAITFFVLFGPLYLAWTRREDYRPLFRA
jgi:uncharacterized membrane protein YphA (DoxX/SURF4 family)